VIGPFYQLVSGNFSFFAEVVNGFLGRVRRGLREGSGSRVWRGGFWGIRTREKGHRTRELAISNPRNPGVLGDPVLCFQYRGIGEGPILGFGNEIFYFRGTGGDFGRLGTAICVS